jgi:creatinine amidohydrolase
MRKGQLTSVSKKVILLILACAGISAFAAVAVRTPSQQPIPAIAPSTVFLENLTWTELRNLIKGGKTTIIVPVGAVEQSGPYIALGKHDVRAKGLIQNYPT